MVPLALRSLLYDRARLLIAIGGVAFAVLLILVLHGILEGTINKATVYTDRAGADLFVTRAGIQHMALSTPLVPAALEEQIAMIPGVVGTSAIVRLPIVARVNGQDVPASLVGFDPGKFGGPWSMAAGTDRLSDDAAVLPVEVARQNRIQLGDQIVIGDRPFRVEGLSRGTEALAIGRVIFVTRQAAQAFLQPQLVNWILVQIGPGIGAQDVQRGLDSIAPGLGVQTREQLVSNDRDLYRRLFGVPVNVMATIGYLVGLLVVGLATYAAAAERARDFGILKAIGAQNLQLYRVVIEIAITLAVCGFVLGLLLTLMTRPIILAEAPELGVDVKFSFAGQVLVAIVVLSLIAALLPVRRIGSIDPREAFTR